MTNSIKDLIGGALWITGAIWFWSYLSGSPLEEYRLIKGAEVAPGTLADVWEDVESDEQGTQWSHGAIYRFTLPDGRMIEDETPIRSGRLRSDLVAPTPIQVEYLPSNPEVSRIKGDGITTWREWALRRLLLGGLMLALFVSPGIGLIVRAFRKRVPSH